MMKARAAIGTLVVVVFFSLGSFQQECVLPQDGKCSRDTSSIDSNKVYDVHHGSCEFNSATGLCSYQQGCADPGMSNWTQAGGWAQAEQAETFVCGTENYSVLESPWLNITYTSCLRFTYSRITPGALDVFVEHRQAGITTVVNRTDNLPGEDHRENIVSNILPGVGKVIFRAYGGGGGGVTSVFRVSVDPGLCYWTGRDFKVTMPSQNVKRWTTPLISPTTSGRVDCLKFRYVRPDAGSRLTVSVQALGEDSTDTVWRYVSPGGQDVNGSCPILVSAPYRILFEEAKAASSAGHGYLDASSFRRSNAAETCPWEPSDARPPLTSSPAVTSPGAPVVTSSFNTRLTTAPWGTTDEHPAGSPAPRDPQTGSEAALIGGTVTAAVVVIALVAVLVVVVVVKKRRSKKKPNTATTDTVNGRLETSPVPPVPNDGDDSYEIPLAYAPRPVPAGDGGYVNMDNSHPQAHDPPSPARPTQETNTYDHPHTYENPTASELHTYESHTQGPHTHEIPNPYEPCEAPTHDPETYETVQ